MDSSKSNKCAAKQNTYNFVIISFISAQWPWFANEDLEKKVSEFVWMEYIK